jgi:CBS domain-containing protein
MLVRDVMTSDPVTVTPGTHIKDALTRLARLGITSMPVVDRAGRLFGIVSEADLIGESVARDPRAQERPIMIEPLYPPRLVEEVSTRSVMTVRPDDDVATAVELMISTGAKSLPVLDDDRRLIGVVSRSDVVAALARSDDVIAADIDAVLESLGHADWLVEVEEGSVDISGPSGAAERSLAHVVAHTVPGVVEVRISD